MWLRAYNSHRPDEPDILPQQNGLVKNDYASVTGGQQNDLMGGDGYCLATLEDNRWLDAELAKHGGSCTGMDDGLLHGPAGAVWPLVAQYTARVKCSCDLEVTVRKCKCFSPAVAAGRDRQTSPSARLRWVQGTDGVERRKGRPRLVVGAPVGTVGLSSRS